jgi:RNA polymerase sigma factor (sigma-70 family)
LFAVIAGTRIAAAEGFPAAPGGGKIAGPDGGRMQDLAEMSDARLLKRYVAEGSHPAFAEIVRRHGPKVYASCRRILGDPHSAEDAAQAAFLVLTRKAAALHSGRCLADWLFWTAKNCALNMRRARLRRKRHEQEAAMPRQETVAADARWSEVRPHLDLALAALPARQREAAVLHYLYGKSQAEIARETGCPPSTVGRRLTSALEKMRRRLSSVGVSLSASALSGLAARAAAADAPAGLAESITSACLSGSAASAASIAVAEAVVKAAKLAQLKLASLLLGAAVVAGGGAIAVRTTIQAPQAPTLRDDPAILAGIRALEPGESLLLPPFRVTGLEGTELSPRMRAILSRGPGKRTKSNRMVYAPERRSALYCGGGGDRFCTNDVWEYHLGANTWRAVSPPDGGDHRALALAADRIRLGRKPDAQREFLRAWYRENAEFAGGGLRTRRSGGPVRPSHVWDGLAYDPVGGEMYWVLTGSHYSPVGQFRQYGGVGSLPPVREGTTMWSFDAASGRWQHRFGDGPRPRTHGMGGSLVYDSRRRRLIWYVAAKNVLPHDYAMWAYDPASHTWTDLAPNGGADLKELCEASTVPPEEIQAGYSPDADVIVAVHGDRCWVYDCASNEWRPGASDPGASARPEQTVFLFDSSANEFLLVRPGENALRAYDPRADRWRTVPVGAPPPPSESCAGYFDPRLGVMVLYDGSDRVWVCRHGH